MPPDKKPFRTTGRQKIIIISMAGQSQKNILQRYLSSINKAHVYYDDEIGSAIHAKKDVGFYHINYVTGKVEQRSCGKLQSGADGRRADVEFNIN